MKRREGGKAKEYIPGKIVFFLLMPVRSLLCVHKYYRMRGERMNERNNE
jgi:hypothetical protein